MSGEERAMKLGDKVSFVGADGVMRPATVTSWSYSSPRPEIVRRLNRWQRMVRWMTPTRFRKSLVVRPYEPAKVEFGFDGLDHAGANNGYTLDGLLALRSKYTWE